MAKMKKSTEDHDEKSMKEAIQKRFEHMFTGAAEPLSNMSIQEVEALKQRIAELEAALAQKPSESEENNRLSSRIPSPSTSSEGNTSRSGRSIHGIDHASVNTSWSGSSHKNLIDFALDFFRMPEDEDPTFIKIVRSILVLTLIANIGVLFLTLGIVNSKVNVPTILSLSILFVLIVGSLVLSFQKKILPAKIIVVPALTVAITYIAQGANGLHDSSIIGYGLTIIIASLVLGTRGILLASVLAVAGVLTVGYSDMAGITESSIAAKTGLDDILIIAILLGTSGLLLRLLVTRLHESTVQVIAANQELRQFQVGLEQRVANRTHDLELASEVGRTITEKIANASEMLTTAAELIRTRFELYYTQVYLTDSTAQKLILRAGTGEVGAQLLSRKHQLLIDSGSLNGQAVLEKKALIVADTRQSAGFKPNPLLPNTRSEMVVPLIVSERVIGVLDLQSEQAGTFSEASLAAFEALAGQLAIAVQNANLFAEVEEARAEVEAQVRRFTEQGWQDFLDAIDHGQKIGFTFDRSKISRLKPGTLSTTAKDHHISIPIAITGTKIGEIHLPGEKDRTWTQHEMELIKATSAQLAQHIDNLRLLAQADQYRAEAQQAVRRLTREGWDSYLQTYGETEPGYLFDLTEVKPLEEEDHGTSKHSVKHPVIVRDEMIGELAVETLGHDNNEAAELLEAVGKQLSDHLENLRLSELNEKRAHREHALRQITSALRGSTNPTTILRTAVRELGSILGRRAVVQLAAPEGLSTAEPPVNSMSQMNSSASQS